MPDLTVLPRLWWFPPVEGLDRQPAADGGTYSPYRLDRLPSVQFVSDEELSWLDREPVVTEWGIDSSDATPSCAMTIDGLSARCESARLPSAFLALAERPSLQARIRSFTACYIDLGDKAVPIDGAVLVHFLSDQQWVRHWLVLVDGTGMGPVLSSSLPIGFNVSDDDDPNSAVPAVLPVDGSIDLCVVADSVEEFIARFWLENEIAFRVANHEALVEPFKTYAAAVRE